MLIIIMVFFHKYILTTLLAIFFILYLPIYMIIYIITFSKWVCEYIWWQKIKKQLFTVSYTYYLPETGKSWDLIIYFLLYTPIYFATKIFTVIWYKQVKITFSNIFKLTCIWIFTFITGIPLIIFKIVKYWHIMILLYMDDPQEFTNKYFIIHEHFFLDNVY